MRRSKVMVAAATGVALISLAACGGSSSNNEGDKGSTSGDGFTESTGGTGKDPEAQGPAPEVDGAATGGEVTVLLPDPDAGPSDLDISGMWSVTGNAIGQDLLFRSLTTFRYDAESKDMVLVPDLATDLGTPSADFKTWTFTLKDGIKWENGDPVTADQVAFGIKRSFDAKNFGTGPGTSYSNPYFLGGDKYKGPYQSGENFEGVSVDGNKLTLKMAVPFSEMDYYAAFAAIGPVPTDKTSKPPAYGLKPLSTGPYKIEKFVPEQELVLVKNENWDANSDAARHQYVDKFTFKFQQDPTIVDETLMSGNEESKNTIATAMLSTNYNKAKQDMGDRVIVGPQPCTAFSMPDYKKIPELEVRQALAFAYPYENAWAAAGEIPGVTFANGVSNPDLGFGILPPGMAGRKVINPKIDGKTITFDPEHAKKLLAAAGYGEGEFEASWVYDASTPEGKAAMEQVKKGYEAAGMKTKPYPYSAGSLYDVWTDPENPIHKKINILGTAWCQDWPSGATFIPPLMKTDAAYNTGKFSEKAVDDKIAEIAQMPAEDQADAWGALDEMIMTEYMPVINRGYIQNIFALGENIGGFNNDTSVGGAPNYRNIFIKQ